MMFVNTDRSITVVFGRSRSRETSDELAEDRSLTTSATTVTYRALLNSHRPRRAGVSLYEVIIALAVIGVLMASSAPSFSRSVEQSHADMAGANLRAIWSAQRLYWLEHRTFAADLTTLESLGLLDPTIIAGGSRYSYAIASSDDETFTATATRIGSGRWSGQFSVDETGSVSGNIQASGVPDISPGFVD